MALENDAAKNSLWHSIGVINLKTSNFATTFHKVKGHAVTPPYKRPQGSHKMPVSHGSSGSFGGNGSKARRKGEPGSKGV